MSTSILREFVAAYLEELGGVIGALIETKPTVTPGVPLGGPQWVTTIEAEGGNGSFVVAIDEGSASAITVLMMGLDGEAPHDTVLDALREMHSQTAGAVSLKPVAGGARLKVGSVDLAPQSTPAGDWVVHAISAPKLTTPITVTVWGRIDLPSKAADVRTAAPVAEPPRPSPAAPVAATPHDRIDVILDIDLPLVVRFGKTQLPLKTLTRLGPGSLIDLGRSPDDPVEVVVSNRVVARGEVVIVSGNYGIRILDVVSPTERIRSLEV